MYPNWRSTRAKVKISVRAIIVTETDSPTSRRFALAVPEFLENQRTGTKHVSVWATHVFK